MQLRGEAKQNALRHNDWPSIASALSDQFSYLSNQEIIISQLDNLHQEQKETLSEYAERARKLLKQRNSTYNFLSDEQKKEHNRTARKAFARGLKDNKLRERLLIRGALEDTIAYSIEAENDTMSQVPNNELFCRSCRNIGHREKDCKRRLNETSMINSFVSALRTFSINTDRSMNNRPINLNNQRLNMNSNRPPLLNSQNTPMYNRNVPPNNRNMTRPNMYNNGNNSANNRFNNNQTTNQNRPTNNNQNAQNQQNRQINNIYFEDDEQSDSEENYESDSSEVTEEDFDDYAENQ